MRARRRLGVLGGTFDPLHVGHLAAARAAHQALSLERIRFIPAARPPHRPDSPRASGYHRMEMVRLAVADVPGWEVSDLELTREGPSYTYDTLTSIAEEGLTPLQIFFITGADAFAEIATWRRYPDLLDLAHFVVVARPGSALSSLAAQLPTLADRICDATSVESATRARIVLLPAQTPNVSATEIRRRIAARQSIEGLVPAVVARYIEQHALYRPAGGRLNDSGAGAATAYGNTPGV